jgi:hypothetical protein
MQSFTGKRTPNAELVNVHRVADIKTTFIMMSTYITCIITDNCGKLIKIKKHQARYNSYKGTQYKIYFNKQSAEQNRVYKNTNYHHTRSKVNNTRKKRCIQSSF